MELYRTIKQEVSVTQVIEKSKFIAHSKPVQSREEADAFISEIKGRYRDATHNVPAMVLGDKMQIQWASDDGEPQGTSGAPIVQVITGEGLTNVAVVVTRYFGGIKLGTGGLVRAYSSSARLAIEEAGVCSAQQVSRITVAAGYTFLSKFQNMAAEKLSEQEFSFVIQDIDYQENVILRLITATENHEKLVEMIANITSGTGEIRNIESLVEFI